MNEVAKHPGGRPPFELRPEVIDEICARIATSSKGLGAVLDQMRAMEFRAADGSLLSVPSLSTAMRQLASNDEFRALYTRAKELQADYLADETIEIADEANGDAVLAFNADGTPYAKMDGNNVRRSEVMIKARQWMAAKLNARRYGDKVDVTSGGEPLPALAPLAIDQRVQSILVLAAERRRLEAEAARLLE